MLSITVENSIVAMVTDLWCHLTYNSSGAWHTVYAKLPSNYISETIPEIYTMVSVFSQTYDSFSNKLILCLTSLFSTAIYSRTSMARTLMARLPRLFRTRS